MKFPGRLPIDCSGERLYGPGADEEGDVEEERKGKLSVVSGGLRSAELLHDQGEQSTTAPDRDYLEETGHAAHVASEFTGLGAENVGL
ncbi:hypothetical protein EYF80_052792 [Liparis tanakae]|uniref:Uncharacterized protein n=1 Tax=Liparis tanakae TaxID=230148 RepID=A0A4Z2F777_9TELE|nr:hypothetical protein EYF80_052792 [Liparis tanakae]